MARNTARVGRRRRVLNEEVLSASNIATRSGTASRDLEPGDTPRYGAGANIENHPQVTSFVPRRFRTLSMIALFGLGTAAIAEVIAFYGRPLSELLQGVSLEELTDVFCNRLIAWTSATLLLLTAAYAQLVYLLRRHRVDDYRGRYRVWRASSWAAIALSLNCVLGVHTLVARVLGNVVDFQMLPANAGWWLIPAALFGGGLLIKLVLDVSECRGALVGYLLSIACLAIAGIHSAGWSPLWASGFPDMLSRALPLAGYTFALVGTLLFARYVILDVQGLIEHATPTIALHKAYEADEEVQDETDATHTTDDEQSDTSAWIDGSEPEWVDDEDRPLSKAERKRLRKQKSRRAA